MSSTSDAAVDLLADGVGSLSAQDAAELDAIEKRLLWLSVLIVHWANHVRPNLDGLKVGGHQASSASCVSLMTALSFQHLSSVDRVAVKPHAAPVLYAIEVSGDRPSAACGGLPTGRGSSPPRSTSSGHSWPVPKTSSTGSPSTRSSKRHAPAPTASPTCPTRMLDGSPCSAITPKDAPADHPDHGPSPDLHVPPARQ